MSLSPGDKFVVGINKGWFGNKYDHDLGFNQFSIGRLYRNVITDPNLPDPSPELPYLSSHVEELQSFFRKLRVGIQQSELGNRPVVRIWAFERFEGLRFDSEGYVIGIDSELLQNLNTIFETANGFGLKIYLCLLDSWSIYQGPPPSIVTLGRQEQYLSLQQTWKKLIRLIVKDTEGRQKFLHNAIHPLLENVNTHPNLFAIDLFNEPEGLIQKDGPEFKFSTILDYIKDVSNYIRSINSNIKISCGFQKYTTVKTNSKILGEYLDFFDFHEYNKDGNLVSYNQTDFVGKPCIVGECGYPVGTASSDLNVLSAIQHFFENSNSKGYAGCAAWFEDYENKDKIIDVIKKFAEKDPLIMELKKQGCFIATAAMGSELHPHVQLLRNYRDDVILQSPYKEQFLRVLDFYYSFSPAIADAMNRNKFFRAFVRYALVYPVILSLKILIKLVGD
jgi:hypothetical protein